MEFPDPVIRVAIEPKTKAGQEKMGIALSKLAEEDPTFKTYTDEETGQTIIAGMGELHLEIIVDRLLREFKVEANVGKPQVSYKETIRGTANVDERVRPSVRRQGPVRSCQAHRRAQRVRQGLRVHQQDRRRHNPKEYIPSVDQGIQGAMQAGVLAGYQVVDVKVTLYDGSYHEVDSSEMAFKIAGSMAFKEGMHKADPVTPGADHEGRRHCPGGLYGRRHRRSKRPPRADHRHGDAERRGAINAFVPLSTMFGYCNGYPLTHTGPRNVYAMEPSHYVELPRKNRCSKSSSRGRIQSRKNN